jgi:bifunctional oligoribonuclease and PAP phosphatase NrnA
MAKILRAIGKEATVVVGYQMPPNLDWIDHSSEFLQLGVDIDESELDKFDAMLILDTSAWAQLDHLGEVIRSTKAEKLILDHHVSGDVVGAIEYRNSKAEATGRIVAEAAAALGVELTESMAINIFAALVTDTGWMRFPSVTSGTYRLAADLVDAGANPAAIYGELYEHETLARLKLVGRILARTETLLDGRLIYTWVRRSDIEETGAFPTDTEDVINETLLVGGTEGALILVEQINGQYKVSFRSRGKMNCSEVAGQFGGGGHKAAAGAMVEGPLEEARTKLLDAILKAMQ